jgi:hypothetical protein
MQQALRDFKESLEKVRDVARNAIKNTGRSLASARVRERYNTVLSAVVVTLSGYFESFLRSVAEQYADEICKQSYPFASLKPAIQETHFHEGAKFLSYFRGRNVGGRYGWANTDRADIARRLASVAATSPYELVWEAFAETGGNANQQTIAEFLHRFGVRKPIGALAVEMGTTEPTLKNRLESFSAIRNECAHTGSATRPPTGVDVRDYCDLLESLATAIVAILSAHSAC